MTFSLFLRRLHLYLGLSLTPWFLIYGLSSVVFNHPQYFNGLYQDGVPQWTVRFERPYSVEIPAGKDLRPVGAQIVKDAGLEGAFGTYREREDRVNVYYHTFWKSVRFTYFPAEKRLLAEDHRFRWDQFLTGMHARGGFEQEMFLSDLWAVVVDLVCLGMLLWIVTGIYMWWKLENLRAWGWLAAGGGVLSFAMFVWRL